jgi:hypothetical protein
MLLSIEACSYSVSEQKVGAWTLVIRFPKASFSATCQSNKVSGNLLTTLWVDSYCLSFVEEKQKESSGSTVIY